MRPGQLEFEWDHQGSICPAISIRVTILDICKIHSKPRSIPWRSVVTIYIAIWNCLLTAVLNSSFPGCFVGCVLPHPLKGGKVVQEADRTFALDGQEVHSIWIRWIF